jgi:hypothetical protein
MPKIAASILAILAALVFQIAGGKESGTVLEHADNR